MRTILPLAERMRIHNALFAEAAEALIQWQDVINESRVCLTPTRLADLKQIIGLARNREPEPT